MELSEEQFRRYARHLILDEVGEEGQEKLCPIDWQGSCVHGLDSTSAFPPGASVRPGRTGGLGSSGGNQAGSRFGSLVTNPRGARNRRAPDHALDTRGGPQFHKSHQRF